MNGLIKVKITVESLDRRAERKSGMKVAHTITMAGTRQRRPERIEKCGNKTCSSHLWPDHKPAVETILGWRGIECAPLAQHHTEPQARCREPAAALATVLVSAARFLHCTPLAWESTKSLITVATESASLSQHGQVGKKASWTIISWKLFRKRHAKVP